MESSDDSSPWQVAAQTGHKVTLVDLDEKVLSGSYIWLHPTEYQTLIELQS